MMSDARISVVMPCFNATPHLGQSVASLRAQSLQDWVLMAVDDGSTDDTAGMLQRVGDARIRVIRQPNAGVSAARNRALERVNTPYVAFLDSDDAWAPDFLETMLVALESRPDADLAYCGWEDLHQPPRRNLAHDPPDYDAQPQRFEVLLERCPWVIHAALSRTPAVRRVGGFDCRFAVAEDYLMWLRMAVNGRLVKVPGARAYYHHDDARPQATANIIRVARQTRLVKQAFLAEQPAIAAALGSACLRRLLYEQTRDAAYGALWSRDIRAAQALFRDCATGGYLRLRDLKYALPALLPASVYCRVIGQRDRRAGAAER